MRPDRTGKDSPSKFIAYIGQACVAATQSDLFSELREVRKGSKKIAKEVKVLRIFIWFYGRKKSRV